MYARHVIDGHTGKATTENSRHDEIRRGEDFLYDLIFSESIHDKWRDSYTPSSHIPTLINQKISILPTYCSYPFFQFQNPRH